VGDGDVIDAVDRRSFLALVAGLSRSSARARAINDGREAPLLLPGFEHALLAEIAGVDLVVVGRAGGAGHQQPLLLRFIRYVPEVRELRRILIPPGLAGCGVYFRGPVRMRPRIVATRELAVHARSLPRSRIRLYQETVVHDAGTRGASQIVLVTEPELEIDRTPCGPSPLSPSCTHRHPSIHAMTFPDTVAG
jgi:hypothetical protein